ncbi:MAG: metallophosphoesterase [Candidatus Woesearchaeota archaeon]
MKILHISDLHYRNGLKKNEVLKAFFEDIKGIKVDFALFTGDITFSGKKEDFINFKNEFYNKIKTHIAEDRIIFCPGNHDVDRALIKKVLGKPIADQINSKENLEEVISEHKTHRHYTTKRLQNYYDFQKIITRSYRTCEKRYFTDFFTNYIYKIGGEKIGITSFNSAWLAEGGQKDYGKLSIGKENVIQAYQKLDDCNLKICLFHHSQDWFAPFDESIDEIKKEYNFAFTGHNHKAKPEIHKTPFNNLIISNTGCLYENDDYFNGYTILEITSEFIKFNVRTYYPERGSFDNAVNLFDKGEWITKRENLPSLNNKQKLFLQFKEVAKESFITTNEDVKDFTERFVYPNLTKKSVVQQKQLTLDDKEESISQTELLTITDRLIIRGRQESGKTCLLFFLGIEHYQKYKKLPFYIDFETINTHGAKPFFREIKHTAFDAEIDNIEERLRNGECIILIDNFSERNSKKVEKFKKFMESFNNALFVVTIKQSSYESLNKTKPPATLKEFDTIYLNAFEAKDIRKLVKLTKPDIATEERNQIVNNLCASLSKAGLPFNPTIISIIIDIQAQVGSYTPINKSSLFDKLIDILLHKHSLSSISHSSFDYGNEVDFLANFANLLYLKNGNISLVKFEEFANSYLQSICIDHISSYSLLDTFIKCNILVKNGDNIEFRVKSFQYFFFAKYLSNYPEENDLIKDNYNYLNFPETIDFLTGLERKNIDLFDFLLEELQNHYELLDFEYDITSFDESKIENGLLSELMEDVDVSEIGKNEVSDIRRDEYTQMRYPEKVDNSEKIDISDPKERFINSLELCSIVARNCELIKDSSFRENAVRTIIRHWSSMLVELIQTFNNDEELQKEFDEDKEFKQLLNVVIPIAFQNQIIELLGTSKLIKVFSNVITKHSISKIEKLLLILIIEDVDENSRFKLLEQFLLENHTYYIREVVLAYLMYINEIRIMSSSKRNKCIKFMSEIVAKRDGRGNKQAEEMVRQQFVKKTKMREKKAGNKRS